MSDTAFNQRIQTLADAALGVAMGAAQQYLYEQGKIADPKQLAEAVAAKTKAAVGEAIDDAKDALDANMVDVAVQTFAASMALAGIAAAKEITG